MIKDFLIFFPVICFSFRPQVDRCCFAVAQPPIARRCTKHNQTLTTNSSPVSKAPIGNCQVAERVELAADGCNRVFHPTYQGTSQCADGPSDVTQYRSHFHDRQYELC